METIVSKEVLGSHVPIEEMDFFRDFEGVADWAWGCVESWAVRHQDTLGRQLVRSSDSIGANLVEGDGRYTDPDAVHFFVIARASARETRLWIQRAVRRGLIQDQAGQTQIEVLVSATRRLNLLISYRRKARNGKSVREPDFAYDGIDPFVARTDRGE